jgi:hypothetical protein
VRQPATDRDDNPAFEEHIYGVTNAHVALGAKNSLFQQLRKAQQGRYTAPEIPIQSPFETDRVRFLEEITEGLRNLDVELTERNKRLSYVHHDTESDSLETLKQSAKALEKKTELLTESEVSGRQDPNIGYVTLAAFGTRNKFAMDLALIDNGHLVPHPEKAHLKRIELEANEMRLWSDNVQDSIRTVAKLGRTSEFTKGSVHGIEVDLPFSLPDGSKHIVSAWAVHSKSINDVFAMPGDSGSFVFAAETWEDSKIPSEESVKLQLTVVGLLFGRGDGGHVGYFIPFNLIKKEIEDLTGGEVTWPKGTNQRHIFNAEYKLRCFSINHFYLANSNSIQVASKSGFSLSYPLIYTTYTS